MFRFYRYLYMVIMLLMGCEEDATPVLDDTVVVDGVIFTGQPVRDLKIWQLSDLAATNPAPLEVDAIVIRSEGTDYFLSPQNGTPGTYYDASEMLQLVPAQFYQLLIVKNEKLIVSATQVPLPPAGLTIEQLLYAIDRTDRNSNGGFNISWTNTQGNSFIGKLVLISDPLIKIDPFEEEDPPLELILEVARGGQYQIPFNQINYYGRYRFVLYAINQDYVSYFGNSPTDVRVQQFTNVFNGFGIFTALTPDTVYFDVVPN